MKVEDGPRVVRNEHGDTFGIDEPVERLDNFKRGGHILAINKDRGRLCVLVRWPGLDDEWMSPRDLYPPGLKPSSSSEVKS